MTYKASIVLDGIVEAESEEQAKEIFAEKMGDKFLCWFVPEDVEVEPQAESEDKNIDEYIDKLQRTTAICINLDWIREYIKMNCPEGSEGRDYILAMLETWKADMRDEEW